MRKNLKEEYIGVEFTTNEGYQVIIIDYIDGKKVQIMFLDEHKYKTWTQMSNLKKGKLKNPFHKSVYGVGYLGTDENEQVPKTRINGEKTREYILWHDMIKRCYDENYHKKYPTYKNDTVWTRWHNYSWFLKDMNKIKEYEYWEKHPNERIALNKDFYYTELGIETDCKEYNLETTRFISDVENSREMAERTKRK